METPTTTTPADAGAATPEASTSNYFAIAQKDDQAAIATAIEDEELLAQNGESSSSRTSVPTIQGDPRLGEQLSASKDDKAEIRRQRIAAAVERSKSEYKAEHAFTERWWYEDESIDRNVLSKPKADRQHLEYLTTGLYYSNPPEYRTALDLILRTYDSAPATKKPLGSLTRELVDIGIRSALALGDMEAGLKLVEGSKSLWKGQNAGHSALSAQVYLKAGRPKDALTPLLISLSSFGLHAPILILLSQSLDQLIASSHTSENVIEDQPTASIKTTTTTSSSTITSESTSSTCKATRELISIVDRAAAWKGSFLQTPLFDSDSETPSSAGEEKKKTVAEDGQNLVEAHGNNSEGSKQTQIDIIITEPIDVDQVTRELALDTDQKKYLEGTWLRLSKGFKGDDNGVGAVERSVREL
ncbi:hypothetical protein IAT40_001403 [Kwoniella sp. CBS 6097]